MNRTNKKITLSEGMLRNILRESVRQYLNEESDPELERLKDNLRKIRNKRYKDFKQKEKDLLDAMKKIETYKREHGKVETKNEGGPNHTVRTTLQESQIIKKENNMNRKIRLNESGLHRIIKEAIDELHTLTADSALAKAQAKLKELEAAGQGNTPYAEKLRRQIKTFDAYNTADGDEDVNKKNAYGRSASDILGDVAQASGIKNFDAQTFMDADKKFNANGKQYNWQGMTQGEMNMHHAMMNTPYVNQDYNKIQDPRNFGYNYGGGRNGFMGIGKKSNTWRLNESKLTELISESIKKVLKENNTNYPPEFINWVKKEYPYFDEKPSWQQRNIYQAWQEEMAEKNPNFTDGMRVGDRQGFRNKNGEIEWHGNGTINGWRSDNSRWTPENT